MSSGTEDLERNKRVVRAFVEAVNRRDYRVFDEIVADGFVRHCQATPDVTVRNRDEFKRFDQESRLSFPDQTIQLERLVAEEAYVSFWARYQGTQEGPMGPFPPSHRRANVDFSGIFRLADGKIQELWVTWDNLALLGQLGHFPPSQ